MADQISSPDGRPRKDADRPSPDVERFATDGQSDARGKGASDEQGQAPPSSADGSAPTGDSGRLGKAPGAGRSDRSGPDDPDGDRGPGVG